MVVRLPGAGSVGARHRRARRQEEADRGGGRGRLRVLQQVEQVELEDGRALGEEPRRRRRGRRGLDVRPEDRPGRRAPRHRPLDADEAVALDGRRHVGRLEADQGTGADRHRPAGGQRDGPPQPHPSPRSKVTTAVASCVGSGLARPIFAAGRTYRSRPRPGTADQRARVRAGILLLRVRLTVAVRIPLPDRSPRTASPTDRPSCRRRRRGRPGESTTNTSSRPFVSPPTASRCPTARRASGRRR